MAPLLPAQGGLDVTGVTYRYTTVKDPAAQMIVSGQHQDAIHGGLIFQEVDNWSGLPGNSITKSVAVNNIPSAFWGTGSIEVQGEGSVVGASVAYSYRIDECFNPQSSPTCEGFIDPASAFILGDLYNALEDDAVLSALEKDEVPEYDADEVEAEDEDEERDSRLERALAISESAIAMLVPQQAMLEMINSQTNLNAYYASTISGGVYPDPVELIDADLPDNKRALRNNLAQQRLHDKMVEMQYSR